MGFPSSLPPSGCSTDRLDGAGVAAWPGRENCVLIGGAADRKNQVLGEVGLPYQTRTVCVCMKDKKTILYKLLQSYFSITCSVSVVIIKGDG